MIDSQGLRIEKIHADYKNGRMRPRDLLSEISNRIRACDINPVWIDVPPDEAIHAQIDRLPGEYDDSLPLFGIPFAIKDNMDLQGHPTTAGCPAYAYIAKETAPAIARLLAAGAILVGKTAMDQFVTGTTGTRSPYGPCPSALNPAYVAGGSSSGSAVAVAAGLVSFSLLVPTPLAPDGFPRRSIRSWG